MSFANGRYGLFAVLLWLLPFSARAEIVQVDNDALARLLTDGVVLIDVRTPEEWAQTGVIAGSHPLMFFDRSGQYDAAAWLGRLAEVVGPEQPLALICASGARTRSISQFLDQQTDIGTVYNVTDGIRAWINAGRPTVAVQP